MVINTLVTHTPTRESQFRLKPLVATIHLLITGGLFASSVTPVYAELPQPMPGGWVSPGGSASSQIDGNTLNINQVTDKVILNWQSFNVGKENVVNFHQPTVTSIALNRINDQLPSRILGQINANGQVYLLNRNGFVFGKDSIINTNSLIASTLNISDNVLKQGITQVFKPGVQLDKQVAAFGDRPDESDDSTSVNKAANITFEKGLKTDQNNQLVDDKNRLILDKSNKPIIVDQGFNTNAKGQLINATGKVVLDKQGKAIVPVPVEAKIHVDKDGQIIIVAPTIENNGTLQAEQHGQIIMAASEDKVYLQAADEKSPFAGLVVEVDTGGKVTNAGDILTKEGNITMAGFAVNQEGRVSATTSVNVNGSIRLVAKEAHGVDGESLVSTSTNRAEDNGDGLGKTSKLTFGKGSVTEVVPSADKTTAIDDQKQPLSNLEATAQTVELKSNSSIKVTGGNVNITATNTPLDAKQGTSGRIFIDKTAKIDVSGVKNVKVAMERNVANISVQSFELRNSPEQLTGVLKGANVKVDLRDKTTIIDTAGASARVKRDINERLTAGGKINLTASGDVIANTGANLDISGGSVSYQDGYIKTTKLIADNARILDISAANPNEHYTGIFGIIKEHNQKFGTTEQWDVAGKGQFEKGYVEGKSAGAINIATPKLAWAGDVTAKFVTGVNQRVPYTPTTPVGGTFTIDMAVFQSPQNVRFQSSKKQFDFSNDPVNGVNPEFPKDANGVADTLVLDSSLTNKSGITNLSVKTWGDANLDKGLAIKMLPGSSLAIEAANITDSASIKTPGGNISLNAVANILYPQAGKVTLDNAAKLNSSGLWVNDFQQGLASSPTDQLWIDGGSVKVTGQNDVVIPVGSSISADGGAWLSASRKLTAGKGGNISLGALGNSGTPSTLTLSGLLSAYSLSKGGNLSLTSGNLVIDKLENLVKDDKGNTVVKDQNLSTSTLALATKNGGFNFAPNFGFSALKLEGNYSGVTVKENVVLDLKIKNLFLDGDYQAQATGSSIRDFSQLVLLPESQRQAQQLALVGKDNVILSTGSQISLEKSSSVYVQSSGSILIDGSVKALAGKINLEINPIPAVDYDPSQTIWLGAHGNLMVAGTSLLNPMGIVGQQTGSILDGGDVSITAKRGYVILENGSQIDVSGTKGKVDIYQENANGKEGFKRTTLGSNAGSIAITAAEGIVVDGTMKGTAGTAQQAAGSLLLSLDRSKRSEPDEPRIPFPKSILDIQLEQKDRTILANTRFGDNIPSELNARLVVSADEIATGGFANLQLTTPGRLIFANDTNQKTTESAKDINLKTSESIKLDAPEFLWSRDSGSVNIESSYVQLGSTTVRDVTSLASSGSGIFKANAQWLGLMGASLWNNFANVNLNSKHDLRATGLRGGDQRDFVGRMVTAANLDLNASQIYPSTLTNFTFNTSGNIHITGSNTDTSPLSAGGSLKFIAANIQQDGVVKAPLGSINFTASQSLALGNNSLSSVSGKGQVTPFGMTKGGLDWVYPLINSSLDLVNLSNQANLRNLIVDAPPQKQLVLNAPEVTLSAGSKLDIAGGGDIMATEFKPVSAEMTDLLQLGSSTYTGSFAVLPTLGSALAPNDPLLSVDWNLAAGQQVYLNGTSQLPAGQYTVLPAYYALMPGAFLITPQANSQDSNITTYSLDGTPIVSGYQTMAGAGTRDARTSGFMVQSMTEVLQQHAQYSVTCASNCADTFRDQAKTVNNLQAENINNSLALLTGKQKILTENYYQTKATAKGVETPILPVDSGQISIIAQTNLLLNSNIDFAGYGAKAKGARMDIAADNIHIVKQLSTTPVSGDLEILDTDLNKLSVDSLLLGGARTFKADGSSDVAVSSKSVTFDQGAQVKMKDLTAAANQKVEVKTDASLTATGAVNTGDTIFNIAGDGALLRVSADKQITLNRTASSGVEGDLIVASGASLKADKSMLLDGSKSNILSGDINLQKGTTASPSSLNISANSINIGAVAGLADDALNISNQKLMNLAVDELVLNSRGTLSFYGNVGLVDANNNPINGGELSPIVFDKLVLNTAAFAGFGADNQAVKLQANTLELANPYASAPVITGNGTGTLDLTANQMTLGGGQVAINGFQTTKLTAQQKLLVDVSSQLQASSDVMLTAGYITATGGTDFKLDATGHNIVVSGVKEVVLPKETTGFGASMNFIADSVSFDSKAQLASGKLGLHALVKDVAVGSSAAIDLAGRKVNFADSADYTPGGQFSAIADKGAITLNTGSNLDLRSGGGSAAAGTLLLKATTAPLKDAIGLPVDNTGSVTLSGQIQASNGNANIDVAWLNRDTGFDQLLDTLKAAGINNAVNFRSHTADIFLSSGNDFSANTITLVADQGAVNIAGQLNANGSAQGGQISIYAGDKITLASGGQLTATGAKGGKVLLSSVDSDADKNSGIELEKASLIDVSGATANQNGSVTLRALQTDTGINIKPIEGNVVGAAKLLAEGVKQYNNDDLTQFNVDLTDDGEINAEDIAAIKAATDSYMSPKMMDDVATSLGHGAVLIPGVEINYTGDLALNARWDLVDWRYNSNPGHLVIRASGDLNLKQTLTDGFKNEKFSYVDAGIDKSTTIVDKLQTGNSWSYSLTAGADTQSADSNRTTNVGNMVIGSNVMVRTGTGDIQLNAGGDISFTKAAATVSKTLSTSANSNVLVVPNTTGWDLGAYVSGTGIAPGTTIIGIENTPVVSKLVSAASQSTILVVPDTRNWTVGAYIAGTGTNSGIAAGTKIESIDDAPVVSKLVYAANGSSVLVVPNTSNWTVGAYVAGNNIPGGTQITEINDTPVVSKTVFAAKGSDVLVVADTSKWTVGDYVAGTGIAPGSTITNINAVTPVSKTASVALTKGATVVPVANTTGWAVDNYVAGTGLAAGTQITAIHPAVSNQVAVAAARGATILTVAANAGWKVGSVLSGTGIAAGTKVTNIDSTGTKITLSAGTSAILAKNAKISALPEVVLSNPTTAALTATTALKIQSTVQLSDTTTAGITNLAVKTQPTVVLSAAATGPISNLAVKTQPTVTISQATTAQIKSTATQAVKTQPYVQLSSETTTRAASTVIKANYINGTVYNAGQATTTDPYGSLGDGAAAKFFYSEYPVNGGDLTVKAGGNINGLASGNDYNDWLLRIGDLTNTNLSNRQPVAWGVGLGIAQTITQTYKTTTPYFQQNIGSFGGGNVAVSAAGDITDLEVAMPTTGKQVAENTTPTSGNFTGFTDSNGITRSQVQVNGGGNLLVSAGGNVQGGSYFLGKGVGNITSQGQVTENPDGKLPIFYTGDAQLNINANKDVKIAGVFDPMIDHKSSNASRADVNFFSYSDTSAVAIRSISGDLLLAANNGNSSISSKAELAKIYPASLQATAFGGSVNLNNDITLYPASKAKLNVFAKQDITGANASDNSAVFKLGMSDADVSLFPTAANPSKTVSQVMDNTAAQISPYGLAYLVHAPTPLHTGDTEPARFVTQQGDIRDISINTAKKTVILSGNDISNLALDVQNDNKDDVTIIEAGRDIVFPSSRDTNTGALNSANGKKLEVAGYGDMLVKAGRNIDLGSSDGLSTVGNAYNPNLSESGANITVITGLNGASPNYSAFITKYAQFYGTEIKSAKQAITLFMQEYTGNTALTTDEAYNQFSKLPADQTLPVQSKLNSLLLPVLFSEIKTAGTASARDKFASNQGGYDAINALFPGDQWKGDLSLFFSKLQSQQGGDINLLVPGGNINAGLAVSFAGAKEASELGIVALQNGAINAVLKDDFLVNKSRVFALNTGDILIWSSEGDIDAGKGAKSAISAPPARASIDPTTGKIKYILPPVVQGSGIRTASSTEGKAAGDVFLFAPKGVINAGEAGIAGNNVFVYAKAIIIPPGSGIDASGARVGAPVASSGGLPAGMSGTSNLTAGVSQMAESSLAAKTASDTAKNAMVKDMVLGMLSVEVLGFGE
jgi:filamentous hemagglutinin family protein